jgi:phosphate:Na+ symporter
MPIETLPFAVPVMITMGLVLFLFGMSQLEDGISALGYETFKRWLSNSTASAAGSAFTGVVSTAILQSSSMVSLLVLAFAAAGALPLYNAIGVILGANVGTTVTGWLVATIGFKLSLQVLALPLMAGGGLLQLVAVRAGSLRAPGLALFGLGLVIFGIDLMVSVVEDLPLHWDIGALSGHGPWVYFLVGAAMAALIQSSSATIMITLAAIHAGVLGLPAAAALVIGANLGTTSTTVLGSIGGHAIKRQLALAQFVFNLAVSTAAFFMLLPLLPALLGWLAVDDPLYALVAFHSLFNLLGLLVFLPLLRPFSHWIGRWFLDDEDMDGSLLGQPAEVVDAALLATQRAVYEMRLRATVLNLHAFHLQPTQLQLSGTLQQDLDASFDKHIATDQLYILIKRQEADLLAFSFELQEQPLTPAQALQLQRQLREARAMIYSAKTLNDIRRNLLELRHNQREEINQWYKAHREFVKLSYRRYLPLAGADVLQPDQREILAGLSSDNEIHYLEANKRVSELAARHGVGGVELSTMLNVNHEVHHALKSLLLSIGD